MAECWFHSTGKFGVQSVTAPSFFNGSSRGRWQTLIEHLKSNIMEKVGANHLLFCRNPQANGAQFIWDSLYYVNNIDKLQIWLLLLSLTLFISECV